MTFIINAQTPSLDFDELQKMLIELCAVAKQQHKESGLPVIANYAFEAENGKTAWVNIYGTQYDHLAEPATEARVCANLSTTMA